MRIRLLFVGETGTSSCRMAAAFARRSKEDGVIVSCAAVETGSLRGDVKATMQEAGVPVSDENILSLDDVHRGVYDVVVVLSDGAMQHCALLPGKPAVLRWDLSKFAAADTDGEARSQSLRALRNELQRRVQTLFDYGYLSAFAGLRSSERLILDNVSDGIIAHDLRRRIVCFNRAAEQVIGIAREDVVGRDCHEVFDGRFCGGKCLFGDDEPPPEFDERRQQMQITTANGEKRLLDVRLRPILDATQGRVGVILSFRDLTREQHLARRLGEIQTFAGIIGRDPKMLEVYDLVRDVADTSVPVLIEGESGTGKELVAAAIHNESQRANRQFVPVNCGALPEGLLESELFGHVKGSFTGAVRDKKGRFELADGGTIFLDEISDISPAMQVRLLRVLQEGAFERVGSEHTVHVSVRVISATNRDLRHEIEEGHFREDLYYRLNVVPVRLPPLRERRADIPLLVEHFLAQYAAEMKREALQVSPEAMDVLVSHDWPGNVRELQNWLQFALVKCRGDEILVMHLPPARAAAAPRSFVRGSRSTRRTLSADAVREALRRCGHNRVETARLLGISRATLYRFFDEHPEVLR